MSKVTCDQCQTSYLIPEVYAGKKVRCGKCGHVFRSPEDVGLWRSVLSRAADEFGSYRKEPGHREMASAPKAEPPTATKA